jgi:TonB family protein
MEQPELPMLDVPQPRNRKRNQSLLASFLIHGAIVFLLVHRAPIFVRTSEVAWGQHGKSQELVYFPNAEERPVLKKEQIRLNKRTPTQLPTPTPAELTRAGTPSGSLTQGPGIGIEAKPAIPLIFPDPAVYPWQLRGVQGDVIVEITIDEQGTVTATKILQSLQQDIDEKVLATLRNWRFKPASMDGITISSRQDVHFHFPG